MNDFYKRRDIEHALKVSDRTLGDRRVHAEAHTDAIVKEKTRNTPLGFYYYERFGPA